MTRLRRVLAILSVVAVTGAASCSAGEDSGSDGPPETVVVTVLVPADTSDRDSAPPQLPTVEPVDTSEDDLAEAQAEAEAAQEEVEALEREAEAAEREAEAAEREAELQQQQYDRLVSQYEFAADQCARLGPDSYQCGLAEDYLSQLSSFS